MSETNDGFGIPTTGGDVVIESPEQREARIRAKAIAAVAAESDEAMLKRIMTEERAKAAAGGLPLDTQGFPADYDKVVVFKGQQKHDLPYVPLGINGYVIKVPRGEEVIIPHCFTKVLEHAVEEVTEQSQGGLVTRPAHTYPYTVKGSATPEEYKAYQVEQRAKAERQIARAA